MRQACASIRSSNRREHHTAQGAVMANETRVTAPIAPRSGRGAYTAIRTAPVTSNATATRHSTRTAGRGAQARNIARLRCRDGGQAWPDVIAFDAAAFIRPPPRTGPPATALRAARPVHAPAPAMRSEEHTSELQSLMRISYAVFCLKKKKQSHT